MSTGTLRRSARSGVRHLPVSPACAPGRGVCEQRFVRRLRLFAAYSIPASEVKSSTRPSITDCNASWS